jgi:hypothetical protein
LNYRCAAREGRRDIRGWWDKAAIHEVEKATIEVTLRQCRRVGKWV